MARSEIIQMMEYSQYFSGILYCIINWVDDMIIEVMGGSNRTLVEQGFKFPSFRQLFNFNVSFKLLQESWRKHEIIFIEIFCFSIPDCQLLLYNCL